MLKSSKVEYEVFDEEVEKLKNEIKNINAPQFNSWEFPMPTKEEMERIRDLANKVPQIEIDLNQLLE